jgi:hypothetical protein
MRDLGVAFLEFRLEMGLTIAADAKPGQAIEDRIDCFPGRAGAVGILDAQLLLAAMVAGKQPV